MAVISGLLYGLSPYLFLDIFVRGAIGEIVAMALIPWVIYGFDQKKKFLSVFALSAVLISHNLFGVLFLVFLFVYLVWNKSLDLRSFTYILFSLGLSAFFLLPAILEKNLIASGAENSFTFNYSEHFLYPRQLLYSKWDYWYSLPGPNDGMSFQLGFANILAYLIGLFVFIFTKNKKLLFFLLVIPCALLFTLGYSLPVWRLLKPIQIIQFPWRFLFISLISFPLLFFYTFFKPRKINKLFYFPAILLVCFALYNTRNYRRPLIFIPFDEYQNRIALNYPKTTTALRQEIVPKWANKEKFAGGQVVNAQNQEKIADIANRSSFTVKDQPEKISVIIRKNYFPGWKLIKLSPRQTIPIKPDFEGNISASLDNGEYFLQYTGTLVERIANTISLFSLLLLLLTLKKSYN